MTTLITGIGLVGTSFGEPAIKRGERLVYFDPQPRRDFLRRKLGDVPVEVVQKDVRDLPALIEAINKHKVDTVVHTAGLIGGRVAEAIYTGLQVNVMGTINVAEAVRLTGVKRLVHISTHGVYDRRKQPSSPVTEDFAKGGGSAYGNSKVAKELLLEAYQRQYGFELMVLRLANVYGLGHFWSGSGGGEMVQSILKNGIAGTLTRIPQEQTRDFEYVYFKDVGRAIDLAATIPMPARNVFNIGEGVITKFDDLVATAQRLLPKLQVEIIPGKSPLTVTQPMSISQAREFLKWEPQYNMEAGFKDFIQDLQSGQ
ncbi:MAG: NAD-dependent epimerase/dehydratase family protein [Deltaproteobacteria bacterium]|nr:NAD-dependent epimerase/dehydratase family protein [Deltaproteobacteria bacterium]